MPIVDYHCHINPQEIAEDRKFENITQVWLGGDHYKWRQMRSNGVDEYYITGAATDCEKFQKWAETLELAIGNPLYHWSHLELQRYFGYHGVLNGDTAEEVWNLCNEKLKEDGISVRNLIRQSNVKLICTTDDPVDDLKWHEVLAADDTFEVQVLPAWRPDKAMNLEKPEYADYIAQLSKVSGVEIKTFEDLKEALNIRLDYFADHGCSVSDHALEYVIYLKLSKRNEGKTINIYDIAKLSGVSIATVSRVINGSPKVSEKTKQKVMAVMEQESYTPNMFARGLGLDSAKTIGIICPEIADDYMARSVSYLEKHLHHYGYGCILGCSGTSLEERESYTKLMLSKRIDTLIFVGSIYAGDSDDPAEVAYIKEAALIDAGYPVRGELKFYTKNDIRYARDMLLMHQNLDFDSVVATEDELAIAVLKYAKVKGIKIPEELSVSGYNNSSLAKCCEPELTSVDSKVAVLCSSTVANMIALLERKEEIDKNLKVPCEIVKRCTTDF